MNPVVSSRAIPNRTTPVHFPAPTGGLNTVDPAGAMPITDSLVQYNLIAAEYGTRVRSGYKEWCTNLADAAGGPGQVRTILPFTGSQGSKDRLFACTTSGIYDVSNSSSAPTRSIAFGDTTSLAGYGVSVVKVTIAGHFLVYCDEQNGLYVYTESTDTWAKVVQGVGAGQIDGSTPGTVDPASFCFVCEHKNRLWFLKKNSATAYYMDSGLLYGTANQFDLALGAKFRSGGDLVGLWSWTMDGGAGIDDSLVAVSRGGDVMIYQGSDPVSAATWGLQGVWYAGGIPAGRDIATNFGGDMLLLSKSGVITLSSLLRGNPNAPSQYVTGKIGNLFNALALDTSTLRGWSLRLNPIDNALIVTVPTTDGAATNQLAMSLWNKSWCQYRDLPIYSSEVWGGKLYFGTVSGRVCVVDGYVDDVLLSDSNSYSAISYSMVSSFQNFGNGRQKQVQMIRPQIRTDGGEVEYNVQARYRYEVNEASDPTAIDLVQGGTWDSATWDSGVWSGEYVTRELATGGFGMGPEFAIALKGQAQSRTIIVGFDVEYSTGGYL